MAFLEPMASTTILYVLRCQHSTYYVGKTTNLSRRLEDHTTYRGAEWTKLHPPIEVMETLPHCDKFDEDKYVLKYMDLYGIPNVRGGSFSQIHLSDEQVKFLTQQLLSANDQCYRCHKKGHFSRDCPVKNDIIDDYFMVPQTIVQPKPIQETSRWVQLGSAFLGFVGKVLETMSNDDKDRCYRCGRKGHWARNCNIKR